MIVYYFTIGIILFFILLYHTKGLKGYRTAFLSMCGLVLLFVSGLRYQVGRDYIQYSLNYNGYANNKSLSFLSEPAVSIVAKLSRFIYDDYATWFFIMAVIAIIPVIITIRKYCVLPDLGVLLFVLLGCWHFSFNLVKQSAAAGILVCGYGALLERNFKRWLIICLVASLFHFSALLMIPVYFLVTNTPSKKTIIITILVGVVTFLLYDRLFELASFLKQGESLVGLYSATRNDSVNILRVLVNCAPLALWVFIRKNTINDSRDFEISFNMSLLNIALNFGSMNSIYLYRFCSYTNIFNIFFIPILVQSMDKRNRRFLLPIIIILYFVFWIYDLWKGETTVIFHWIFER